MNQLMKIVNTNFLNKQRLQFILLVVTINCFAQSNEAAMPTYSPVSPEVANLTKYAETSVNLYSGVPNISFPIYTITTADIQIPISVSYHAGGHKVEEIASWVGLGWSLNAGGVIYRQVRQKPDDASGGYIRTLHTIAEWEAACNETVNCVPPSPFSRPYLETLAKLGIIDFAPDQFNFSFLGYSGSFYFNQNRTAQNPYGDLIQAPISDIKIEYTFDTYGKFDIFKLTTPDGNIFIFRADAGDFLSSSRSYGGDYSGNLPQLNAIGYNDNNVPQNTSWKLTKIELKSGELIEFEYEQYSYLNVCTLTGESKLVGLSTNGEDSFGTNLSSGHNTRIKKINFKNGYVTFTKQGTPRKDLFYDNALDKVEVFYQSPESTTTQVIEKVQFKYDYFYSATTDSHSICLGNYNPEEIQKRLRLDEITYFGNQNSTSNAQVKRFEYNTNVVLPHRFSKAQDYWGYYNGKMENKRMVPTLFLSIHTNPPTQYLFKKANREIDPDFTQACILNKIYHTEGGVTELKYENNDRSPTMGFAGSENIFEPSTLLTESVDSNSVIIVENGKRYFRKNFTVTEALAYRGYFEFVTESTICSNAPSEANDYNSGNLPIVGCDIRFHIKNRVLGQPNVTHSFGVPIGYKGYLYIEPGQYTLEIEINSNTIYLTNQNIQANVVWRENRFPTKKMIGGIRVKEINNFETPTVQGSSTTPTTQKLYVYKDNSNNSSGWIRGVHLFTSEIIINVEGMSVFATSIVSNNNNPAIFSEPNNVGYTVVREITKGGVEDLVQESSFSFYPNQSTHITSPTFLNWTSGKLFKQRFFKKKVNSGGISTTEFDQQYDLVHQKEMYTLNSDSYKELYPRSEGVEINPVFYTSELGDASSGESYYYPYKIYTAINNETTKTYTKEYFFQNNEVIEVVNSIEYLYDGMVENQLPTPPKHLYPIKIINTTNNSTTEQNLYYPQDLLTNSLFNTATINHLISQNQINTPLLKESFYNGQKTGTVLIKYKNWGNNALNKKVLLPEIIQVAKGDSSPLAFENRLRYVNIDPLGAKTREVKSENGTSVVYLWGYNKTLPVAKIENRAFADIPANLVQAIESAENENDLVNALNQLRTALNMPEVQVSTYTHIPLVGVKTMTDPRGYVITYHYDAFNRLEKVLDMDGKIVSENEYHYRTQN